MQNLEQYLVYAMFFIKMRLITALITPFKYTSSKSTESIASYSQSNIYTKIDLNALESLLTEQFNSGVRNIVIMGSTGEGHALTSKERIEIVEFVTYVKKKLNSAILLGTASVNYENRTCYIDDTQSLGNMDNHNPKVVSLKNSPDPKWCESQKLNIIASINANITQFAIDQINDIRHYDLDGFMVACPYYNKPTQEGLFRHFDAIAETANGMPIMLYDIPGRTGVSISTETIKRLIQKYSNISSLKLSTNELSRMNDIFLLSDYLSCDELTLSRHSFRANNDLNDSNCGLRSNNFSIFCGDDESILSFGANGASGIVSVISNVFPVEMLKLCEFIQINDFDSARKLFSRIRLEMRKVFCTTNPIGIKKAACEKYTFMENICRLPLVAD